jgi:hypothetical protein
VASRTRWLAVAAVGVAVLVALFVWRGCRDGQMEADAPQIFGAGSVPVVSPELAVSDALVRGTVHPDYTDWSCILECREPDGCHAEVQLTIAYLSQGSEVFVKLGGRLDAAMGETMRLGRAQRPPTGVDEVTNVTLEVTTTYRPGGPRPTPRI